jgi:cobalt-zinc-cadmium efflux system outer membrane protein
MNRIRFPACLAGIFLVALTARAVDWTRSQPVVDAALSASPSLREIDARLAGAQARQRGAGALPNPMLMTGVQNQQVDLSTDPMMTMYMVGASQTFVRTGRRDALRRGAATDVTRLEHERESLRAAITRDTLVAWNEAATADSQIAANDEIAKLAATIGDAARIRYETGSAAQIDIIRARLEESNLRHEILMQRGLRDRALARLRALLDLRPDTPVPDFALGPSMQHPSRVSDVALHAETPAIAALDAEVAHAEEEILLAKLLTKPDVSLEASYGFRPQQKDMFSVVARIELPIRKATLEPRLAEAIARRDEARARIDRLRQELESDLGIALARRNEAVAQIELHVEELVPEARLGFQSALASYQAGKTTFDSVLGALQSYRTLNVDYYDFQRQLLVAEAEIEAIQHGATRGSLLSMQATGETR